MEIAQAIANIMATAIIIGWMAWAITNWNK
jgi:hypothetical protein